MAAMIKMRPTEAVVTAIVAIRLREAVDTETFWDTSVAEGSTEEELSEELGKEEKAL